MNESSLILIIEDRPEIVDILKTVAELAHYKTETIQNGQEAANRLHGEVIPGLIFLDLHIPDVNGLEILRRVRENERWKAVNVYVITGDETAAGELEKRGPDEPRADKVLLKPMSVIALYSDLLALSNDCSVRSRPDSVRQ